MASQSTYTPPLQVPGPGLSGPDLLLRNDDSTRYSSEWLTPGQPVRSMPVTIEPIITTPSKPRTGGEQPIVDLKPGSGGETPDYPRPGAPLITSQGNHFVMNGAYRIEKKKVALAGGGLLATAILLKIIL